MQKFKRGQIWWFEPPFAGAENEIIKIRPCVIVTNDSINASANTLVVVPLTTNVDNKSYYHVSIVCNGNESVVCCERLQRVHVSCFRDFIGECDATEIMEINNGIIHALNIDI